MKLAQAKILSNEEILPKMWLMRLEAPEIASIARPGQFIMVRCGSSWDPLLRRPFSLHQISATLGTISLLFGVVGRGTRIFAGRKAGDRLDILGPLGRGFEIEPRARNLLLVAGGLGIAALRSIVDFAAERSITLFHGARSSTQVYPASLIPPEVEYRIVTEDGSAGDEGLVTQFVKEAVDWADQVFACGPKEMLVELARLYSSSLAGGRRRIQAALEEAMACGVGACLTCSCETRRGRKLVCSDGPVFDLSEIVWG